MSLNKYQSPELVKSSFSASNRRDVLWNVVEPGDPYDIRKSMIAKLPGDREHFMGDNLQIVCLLQSAQIERLCQFLDDYKFRFRQIERRQLDRHSYEIQIKQLTQRLLQEGSFKSENYKLKQFVKKQTVEIQELKGNRHYVDNNLRANYESALAQIENIINECNYLKSEKQSYIIQINNYATRLQALENAKQREIRELYLKYSQDSKYLVENQTRSIKSRYESEINRLEYEIKRLKQFNDAKNEEINEINIRNRNLALEIQQLNTKKSRFNEATYAQLQERFKLITKEMESANLKILQSAARIDQSARNQIYWKQKYNRSVQDYKLLQSRCQQLAEDLRISHFEYEKVQSSIKLDQSKRYELQISNLHGQLERVQNQKASEYQKYLALQKSFNELEYNYSKISVIERQNIELRNNLLNSQDLKRKISEYQTKIALLSQQLQRLTQINRELDLQRTSFDEVRINFEEHKRKSIQKEKNITQKYESEMQRKILEYQSRIAKFASESDNQFQMRLQAINREVERLNLYVREKTQQSEFHKKRIQELQNSITQKYEVEVKRQNYSFQTTIRQLKVQNQELSRKLKDTELGNKKTAEYENKIVLLQQEIQRLNYQLRLKVDELENIKRVQNELKITSSYQDMEISRKISIYQDTQMRLSRQNDDLKKRLQEIVEMSRKIKQYEERLRVNSQEAQRLNQTLRQKTQALNKYEIKTRSLTQQIESLKKIKHETQNSFNQKLEYDKMESSRRFSNYQQSLSSIQRQYEELRRKMMDMGTDTNKKVNEYENKIILLTQELERVNQNFRIRAVEYDQIIQNQRNEFESIRRQLMEGQVNTTQKYEQEISRKSAGYEKNISVLTRQIEEYKRRVAQFQNIIRKKNQDIGQIQNRYRIVSQEYESFKIQVKTFEGEVNKSQNSYEQNISRLASQFEDLKKRAMEYENRLVLITQENQRLNLVIQNLQQEKENLRKTVNQLRVDITHKYQVETSRKINGYEQIINKEKQEGKRKIVQYQNRIANCNREIQQRNRAILELENKIKNLFQQNENLGNRFRELQLTVTQKYEVETSRKISNFEQTIHSYGKQIEQYKQRINELDTVRVHQEKQILRLNGLLKNAVQDNEKLNIKFREYQININHTFEAESHRQVTIYEQKIGNLSSQLEELRRKLISSEQDSRNQNNEIEDLRRKIRQYGDVHRGLLQYQSQFNIIRQQLQRVNANLKNKIDEAQGLDNRLRLCIKQLQQTKLKYQQELNHRSSTFEININSLKKENEDLKRLRSELQNRLVSISQEAERINNILKTKSEELFEYEKKNRNLGLEIQNYKERLKETERSSNQRYQVEVTKTINIYEHKISNITIQYEDFKRSSNKALTQLQNNNKNLLQEIQKLSQMLKKRTEELMQLQALFKNSQREVENLQRGIQEVQINSSKRIEFEKTNLASNFEKNISTFTRQYQQLRNESSKRFAEYESNIAQITRQLERVNENLRRKVEQANNSQRKSQQYIQEIEQLRLKLREAEISFNQRFQFQISKKSSSYQQNISTYKLELENQQRKIKQLLGRIAGYQNSIALMTQQIERLNQVLRGKAEEARHYQVQVQKYISQLEGLKSNISGFYTTQIEKLNHIISQKSQQHQILQQKYGQLCSSYQSEIKQYQSSQSLVSREYENSKKNLVEYEQSIKKLYSQFERLQTIINELKGQRQTLIQKNHGLMKQIERLTLQNKDQQNQLYEIRLKLTDEVALQKRINEHMGIMVVLFAQIQSLRERVKEKEKQVKQVRRSSLAPFKA